MARKRDIDELVQICRRLYRGKGHDGDLNADLMYLFGYTVTFRHSFSLWEMGIVPDGIDHPQGLPCHPDFVSSIDDAKTLLGENSRLLIDGELIAAIPVDGPDWSEKTVYTFHKELARGICICAVKIKAGKSWQQVPDHDRPVRLCRPKKDAA